VGFIARAVAAWPHSTALSTPSEHTPLGTGVAPLFLRASGAQKKRNPGALKKGR
jgi:hypothetical protein